LRLFPVLDGDKAVFPPAVADARAIHLPREPLPSIEAEIDGERKPALHPRMHESEERVDKIMIKEQALTLFENQVNPLCCPVAPYGIGLADSSWISVGKKVRFAEMRRQERTGLMGAMRPQTPHRSPRQAFWGGMKAVPRVGVNGLRDDGGFW